MQSVGDLRSIVERATDRGWGEMRPSSTVRGAAWIEQFETDDRTAAAALLNSIRFASADEVLGGVKAELESLLSGGAQFPLAIFPVLAKEDMQPVRPGALPNDPVAFVDFDPSQALSPAPGSEAHMANLAREVARTHSGRAVIRQGARAPITLARLLDRKVRTLVFVTDYIGSGKQVVDYVATWHRNPTIRSWMSFGWVKLIVVAFSSSPQGLTRVLSAERPPEVRVREIAPSLANLAIWEQERQVERLCTNYAKRADLSRSALGYAKSGGLFASSLSIPNNLPAVLVESKGRWRALFDNRSVATSLVNEIGTYTPVRDLAHELSIAREERLAERFADGDLNPRWASRLAVLALLPSSEHDVARKTGYTLSRVSGVMGSLVELGLIDEDGQPTPQGRQEITQARRRRRIITARLQGSSDLYYPRLTR